MKKILFLMGSLLAAASLQARPLVTEEAATIGHLNFQATLGVSQRDDKFEPEDSKYKTVVVPVELRFGLTPKIDAGFELLSVTQTLTTGSAEFTGTQNARFSPSIKYSPNEYWGFKALWHARQSEDNSELIPIGVGNEYEAILVYKTPTVWPLHLNLGYNLRSAYYGRRGVTEGPMMAIDPGEIFSAKAALEIPLGMHFSMTNEWAYYQFNADKQDDIKIAGTAGDALDTFVSLCWAYQGWTFLGGVGFGLLDEAHTSFDLTRGAGDVQFNLGMSYKLKAKKSQSQR